MFCENTAAHGCLQVHRGRQDYCEIHSPNEAEIASDCKKNMVEDIVCVLYMHTYQGL